MKGISYHVVVSLTLLIAMPAMAQDNVFEQYRKKKMEQFNNYEAQKRKQFEEYRKKKNAEFANYLGQSWESMDVEKPDPLPKPKPEPKKQPVAPKEKPDVPPVEVKPQEVVVPPVPDRVKPIEVPPAPKPEASTRQDIDFMGATCQVSIDRKLRLQLKSNDESEVKKAWQKLSDNAYDAMFDDFARLNLEMNLNGWATLQLAKTIGRQLQGADGNEATVVAAYLMTQLGYDTRLVRVGAGRLVAASPANTNVCNTSFLTINGKRYYLWELLPQGTQIYTYRQNVEDATRPVDFTDAPSMKLQGNRTDSHVFTSKQLSKATASVSVRKNLINYYNTVPALADWSIYAAQPLDMEVSRQLLPGLKAAISGMSQWQATRVLLQFVQTAFNYKTDEDQFGRERTFFKEELFFYPFCDCEDRSILFSDLAHTLLGLDVVLLHYPNHLCTAVRFTTNEAHGDYLTIDGERYFICDPTYIDADCGMCMPQYKAEHPKVHRIKH